MALLEYKCPNCGGALQFSSTSQKVACPYCDSQFEPQSLAGYDSNLSQGEDNLEWPESGEQWNVAEDGLQSYVCTSCGGEIIGDENTAATSCPFCGNPVIVMEKFKGILRPDYVIPFKLSKEQAKDGFKSYLQGKRLLPKVFRTDSHIDEIKGVYVPFWIFDAEADVNVCYKGTRTSVWRDNSYQYSEKKYYSILRGGKVNFDHVPVDGSRKMPDDMTQSLEPFNFGEAVAFATPYLAGYVADKYDVTAEECAPIANERIKKTASEYFADTVGDYEDVTVESCNISLLNPKTSYALYPVWMLTTTWNDKPYIFAMNGQTGKFVGDLPIDKKLEKAWGIGIALAVALGLLALLYLLWLL